MPKAKTLRRPKPKPAPPPPLHPMTELLERQRAEFLEALPKRARDDFVELSEGQQKVLLETIDAFNKNNSQGAYYLDIRLFYSLDAIDWLVNHGILGFGFGIQQYGDAHSRDWLRLGWSAYPVMSRREGHVAEVARLQATLDPQRGGPRT